MSTALVASAVPRPMARNMRDSDRMKSSSRGFYNNRQPGGLSPASLRLPGWGTFLGVELDGQPVVTGPTGHVRDEPAGDEFRVAVQDFVGQWYKYLSCHA